MENIAYIATIKSEIKCSDSINGRFALCCAKSGNQEQHSVGRSQIKIQTYHEAKCKESKRNQKLLSFPATNAFPFCQRLVPIEEGE